MLVRNLPNMLAREGPSSDVIACGETTQTRRKTQTKRDEEKLQKFNTRKGNKRGNQELKKELPEVVNTYYSRRVGGASV